MIALCHSSGTKPTDISWLKIDANVVVICNSKNEKKRPERRKHCAPAVVRRSEKFRPAADPLPGGAGRPKFSQLEMVSTLTYRPSLVKIDARNFELSW